MKTTAKRLFICIAVLAIAVIVVALMAIIFLRDRNSLSAVYDSISSSLVDSEVVYIILALLFAVPIALCGLTVTVVFTVKPLARKNGGIRVKKQKKVSASPRFSNLSKMDEELKSYEGSYVSKDLAQICKEFQHYAASNLGLYYDIGDIRRFIAGMGIGRLMILRGMSGTGKTSLAYAAGEYFGNPATIVPIQPMWKERSDIVGYFNEFTKRFNETTLLCKLYEAGGKDDIYITVLDEVNIARIEYYFAEFLSLLELPDAKKRKLEIVSDSWNNDPERLQGGKLLLPENMWFVGTANNDDSTFAISDKVYDRAAVIDLEKKRVAFEASKTSAAHISYKELSRQFEAAKKSYVLSKKNRANIVRLDSYLTETFRVSFGNRIMRQIEDYVPIMVACGGTEIGALDDIFARKILRKLEQLSPALIKSEVPKLMVFLEELFNQGTLPLCREYLEHLQKSV